MTFTIASRFGGYRGLKHLLHLRNKGVDQSGEIAQMVYQYFAWKRYCEPSWSRISAARPDNASRSSAISDIAVDVGPSYERVIPLANNGFAKVKHPYSKPSVS